jgi:hypothetical protein
MNKIKVGDRQHFRPVPSLQNIRDLRVSIHGSISLFHSLTDIAREWMRAHCPADGDHRYFCGALVVEPRYVEDLLAHAIEDGLSV